MPLVVRICLAGLLLLGLAFTSTAQAGPPAYLLLRRADAPGSHGQPGQPAAQYYDVRTYGYAYGHFGIAPRTHWSRHFGTNRMYTQWSKW